MQFARIAYAPTRLLYVLTHTSPVTPLLPTPSSLHSDSPLLFQIQIYSSASLNRVHRRYTHNQGSRHRPSQPPRARTSVPPRQPCSDMALLRAHVWGAPCPCICRGNAAPWKTPLGAQVQRGLSTFGQPASGARGGGGPIRTAHKLTTHSKPLLFCFPNLHYPFSDFLY